jgi:GNAT superfamily N-acetyltransferase
MEKNYIKSHFQIRDADASEQDSIRDLTVSAYEEYATVMPPSFWTMYRQRLLETLNDDNRSVERIVAVQDGAIRGSVLLYPATANAYSGISISLQEPEVRFLAVHPSMRGQGLGKALMDECVQRALRSGANALGLHTMELMRAAVHMYERMGFVRVPEHDFSVSGVLVMGYSRSLD